MCDGSHTSEDEDTKVMNYATRTVLDEMIKFEKSVDTQFKEFRSDVDKRFDKVDKRFDKVDKRFDKVDKQLDKVARLTFWSLIGICATLVGTVVTVVVGLISAISL